jgi:hypothetical protein
MLFSINRQYRWNLGFAHRDWRLTTGTEFDIVFSIDGGQAIYTTGRAVQSNHAIIRLADSMDLFDRFRRGHMLRIAADSRVFSFGLEGTAAMLAQLHDCVRRHTQPANVANASNGKRRTGPTSREMIESPTLQAEAAVLLANVMAAANVNRYSIGTPEEASKASVHALWTAPSVVGSLLIIPTRRIDDPEIPGIMVGVNAYTCNGAFMSGSLPATATREVRVTTTCQPPGGRVATSYYFGVPRPRGGLYLFATKTNDAGVREDAERTDEILRNATYRSVKLKLR